MTLLLDSVIVIDYLNGVAAARAYVDNYEGEVAVSVVTTAEVLVGVDEADVPTTLAFLDAFPLLVADRAASVRATRLRREHGWKLPDPFQAALVQQHGLQLATRKRPTYHRAASPRTSTWMKGPRCGAGL